MDGNGRFSCDFEIIIKEATPLSSKQTKMLLDAADLLITDLSATKLFIFI